MNTPDLGVPDALENLLGGITNGEHTAPRHTPNHSQELTRGRRKTLRETGWNGVQGTHKQQKYVKLRKLKRRKQEAERQVNHHSGKRAEQFQAHADQLAERIERQEEKIEQAESA
jgi:hypothetical protein